MIASMAAWLWPAAAHAVVYGAEVDGDFAYYGRHAWSWQIMEASLKSLSATGATVARSWGNWEGTEPKPPRHGQYQYNWKYDDMVVRGLATAHLRWDPELDFTPKWAEEKNVKPCVSKAHLVSPVPPANNAVYAAYVAAFARRYGVGGTFWRANPRLPNEPVTTFEIWNEPDDRWTWGPNVDLQDYAKLFMAAYHAIKRVDRHSMVITAGLAFSKSSLPRLLAAFEGLPMDGLGVHAYTGNSSSTVALVRWAESQMIAYHRSRTPLVVNEYGWNSVPGSWQAVPRRVLDQDVLRAVVGLSKIRNVSSVIPFEWADPTWGLNGGELAKAIKQARSRRG